MNPQEEPASTCKEGWELPELQASFVPLSWSAKTGFPLQSLPHTPRHPPLPRHPPPQPRHPEAGVAEQQGLMGKCQGYGPFFALSLPLQSILGNLYHMKATVCVGCSGAFPPCSSPLTGNLMLTKFKDLALSLTCCYFDLRPYHWMAPLPLEAGLTLNPIYDIWALVPRSLKVLGPSLLLVTDLWYLLIISPAAGS